MVAHPSNTAAGSAVPMSLNRARSRPGMLKFTMGALLADTGLGTSDLNTRAPRLALPLKTRRDGG